MNRIIIIYVWNYISYLFFYSLPTLKKIFYFYVKSPILKKDFVTRGVKIILLYVLQKFKDANVTYQRNIN